MEAGKGRRKRRGGKHKVIRRKQREEPRLISQQVQYFSIGSFTTLFVVTCIAVDVPGTGMAGGTDVISTIRIIHTRARGIFFFPPSFTGFFFS